MGSVRYTRRARQDLLDLWTYLAPRNAAAADRMLDRIERGCRSLSEHPHLGPSRPNIAEEARVLIDRWLAIYRVMDDDVRVVDGVRDLLRLDWPVE